MRECSINTLTARGQLKNFIITNLDNKNFGVNYHFKFFTLTVSLNKIVRTWRYIRKCQLRIISQLAVFIMSPTPDYLIVGSFYVTNFQLSRAWQFLLCHRRLVISCLAVNVLMETHGNKRTSHVWDSNHNQSRISHLFYPNC